MMERTDRHFRLLMRLIAPRTWLYTEMITAAALTRGEPERHLAFDAREHPLAIQLGGSDPLELAAAARLAADAGYDEINLNVGCPSGRVQAGCFGAALLRDPGRVAECIGAIRESVDLPVTVKTRIGVDEQDDYDFLLAFVETVVAAGISGLIVHARKAWLKGLSPKENREIPPLDYARVHRLKADFPDLEIAINGGLTTREAVLEQLSFVDGVMLGRSAYRDPLSIGSIDRAVFGLAPSLSLADVLTDYLQHIEAELEQGTPLKIMTRHLMGLFAGRPGARQWRHRLATMTDGSAALAELRAEIDAVSAYAAHAA